MRYGRGAPTEDHFQQIARWVKHQHCPRGEELLQNAGSLLARLVQGQTRLQQFDQLVDGFNFLGVLLHFLQGASQLVLGARQLLGTLGYALFKLGVKLGDFLLHANTRSHLARHLAGGQPGDGPRQHAHKQNKEEHDAPAGGVVLLALLAGQPDLFLLEPQKIVPGSVIPEQRRGGLLDH